MLITPRFERAAFSQAYQVDPIEALDLSPLTFSQSLSTPHPPKVSAPLSSRSGETVGHQRSERTSRTAFVCPRRRYSSNDRYSSGEGYLSRSARLASVLRYGCLKCLSRGAARKSDLM